MVKNPTDQFTNNSFIDKMLKVIPQDPLTQAHYMYLLTLIVFCGLMGYAINTWWLFFTTFELRSLFSGLFMTAIGFMSLFGLKQTRGVYLATRAAYDQMENGEVKVEIEDPKKMLEEFSKQIEEHGERTSPAK